MARTCINFSKHMEKLCKVTAFGVFSSRKYLLAPSPHSAVCDGHSTPFFFATKHILHWLRVKIYTKQRPCTKPLRLELGLRFPV